MMDKQITRDWVEERLDILHPAHVTALVRLLADLRELFEGDLEAMIILAATSISLQGDGWWDTLFAGKSLNAEHTPTNTQSIAYATKIPRETVRRKLRWLEGKGWVARDGKGNWQPTSAAAQDLRSGSDASVTYLTSILKLAAKIE